MNAQPQLPLDKPQAMSPQEFLDLCAREAKGEVLQVAAKFIQAFIATQTLLTTQCKCNNVLL